MTKVAYMFSALFTALVFHHATTLSKGGAGTSFLRPETTTVTTPTGTSEQNKLDSDAILPRQDSHSHSDATRIVDVDEQQQTDTHTNTNTGTENTTSTASSYTPEALADRITALPGITFTPSFEQFSGYLDVTPTRKIHYWYIESMNDPSNDPVVLWTNGGPGCSGLLGLGTEMGPYIFNSGGTLSLNPFTWNTIANIIYVEQPAGVGFSYFTDSDDANVDDERAALDNYRLIKGFFERFPERKNNQFFIASESFGGHYIPHLAKTILSNNTDNSINFRGWLVGNPYVDPFSNDVTMIQTYYMHGLIALPLYAFWEEICLDRNNNNYDEDKCDELMDDMMKRAGKGINPYAVDYPTCLEPDNTDYPPQKMEEEGGGDKGGNQVENEKTSGSTAVGENGAVTTIRNNSRRQRGMSSSQVNKLISVTSARSPPQSPPFLGTEDVYHPCAEAHLFKYLNRDDVKEALHVDTDRKWSMCTDDITYSPEDQDKPQMEFYEDLIKVGKKSGSDLKMMVFSGDDDSICSTASTQYWIWGLTDPIADKVWQPWQYKNETAGYLTHFDLGKESDSSFIFVTVHGAGHEVPAYRPAEALAMFTSYLTGSWDVK